MDVIRKKINLETLKSHIPGALPYIPVSGGDFTAVTVNGNWGGYPMNVPNDCNVGPNSGVVSYSKKIRDYYGLRDVLKSGTKLKKINESKYTPKFKEAFPLYITPIGYTLDIRERYSTDKNGFYYRVLENKKFEDEKNVFLLLINEENILKLGEISGIKQEEWEDEDTYYRKLLAWCKTEYERMVSIIGILFVDSSIEGDLVPEFMYYSQIAQYLAELNRLKRGDCCNIKKFKQMGGNAMVRFLNEHMGDYTASCLDPNIYTNYSWISSSREEYEAGGSDTSSIDKYFDYKSDIDYPLTRYLPQARNTEKTYQRLNIYIANVYKESVYYRLNRSNPLTPKIEINLGINQNFEELGFFSEAVICPSCGNNVLPGYEVCPYCGNTLYDGKTGQGNVWIGEWDTYTGETLWRTESKLEDQLRSQHKEFDDNGELLPCITVDGTYKVPYVVGDPSKKSTLFNISYVYSDNDYDYYSCDYIKEIRMTNTKGNSVKKLANASEVEFVYVIGGLMKEKRIIPPVEDCELGVEAKVIRDGITLKEGSVITVTPNSGSTPDKITVSVSGESKGVQYSSLVIKSKNKTKVISIEQDSTKSTHSKAEFSIEKATCDWNIELISGGDTMLIVSEVVGNILTVDPFVAEHNLTIVSTTSWSISSENIVFSRSSGIGDARLTMRFLNDIEGSVITIKYGNRKEKELVLNVVESQDRSIKIYYGTEEVDRIDATNALKNFDLTIKTTGVTWNASTNVDWCSISPRVGGRTDGTDTRAVSVVIESNTTPVERKAVISFKCGAYTKKLSVSQEAGDYIFVTDTSGSRLNIVNFYDNVTKKPIIVNTTKENAEWKTEIIYDPYIIVSPDVVEFNSKSGQKELDRFSIFLEKYDIRYEYEEGDTHREWCHLTDDGIVRVGENPMDIDRSCTIVIEEIPKNEDEDSEPLKATIIVKQERTW